jgi:hypothetical protein
MTVDKNRRVTTLWRRQMQFSSVHTVGHFRLKLPDRSRYCGWSAFHVSTAVITTTRVIWFKKFVCFDDAV